MDLAYAAFLGVLQGLTEFLPISSTAHLVLGEHVFGLEPERFGLPFDAAIQLGTTAAVVWYYRADLLDLAVNWRRPAERRLLAMLAVATAPALVVGFLLRHLIAGPFRALPVIAAAFVLGGIAFLAVERTSEPTRTVDDMTVKDALIIGLCQCLALVPGVSRSGSTIVPAMWLGLARPDAARFTFLLSIPVLCVAGLKGLVDAAGDPAGGRVDLIAMGMITALVTGYLSIVVLLRYLASHRLDVFAWYRFALAAMIVGHLALGGAP